MSKMSCTKAARPMFRSGEDTDPSLLKPLCDFGNDLTGEELGVSRRVIVPGARAHGDRLDTRARLRLHQILGRPARGGDFLLGDDQAEVEEERPRMRSVAAILEPAQVRVVTIAGFAGIREDEAGASHDLSKLELDAVE
jgi:hypothetical protein